MATITLLGMGLSMAVAGVVWRFDRSITTISATPFFLMAAGMMMSGMLLVPSAGFALLRLVGHPDLLDRLKTNFHIPRPTILILGLPIVFYAGYLVNQIPDWEWLLQPPLYLLAIGLPLLWLVYLGIRGLPTGSPQLTWGVFGSGLVLSPLLIMLAEIAALGSFLAFGAFNLINRPEMVEELTNLAQRLAQAPPNPALYQRILNPWLLKPGIIYTTFVFIVIVVPLIEEALKPIGVWLLARRDLSPSAGFTIGLVSGAGYALFESLAFTSGANEWSVIAAARIGAGVIHILTTGLTGWALATAWKQGSYLRLGVTYLTSVLLHALWNGLTLLAAGYQFLNAHFEIERFITNLSSIGPWGFGTLAITAFVILLGANRMLRGQEELTQLKI